MCEVTDMMYFIWQTSKVKERKKKTEESWYKVKHH